jgi:CheY-like chemotaxis protein
MDISEIKQLQREVIKVSERERRHLGQDLHDGLEHHLTSIAFLAKTHSRELKKKGWEETQYIDKIVTLADDSLKQTEDVVRGLNPVSPESNDLITVVEELIHSFRTTYEIVISLSYDKHLYIQNNIVANHLFFIIEEALINAVKHAQPHTIEVSLTQEGDWITLIIKDDGTGIPRLVTRQSGVGLQIMTYRASIIGASLDIRPCDDGGTVLTCRFNNRYGISDASDSSFSFKGFSVALETKKRILIIDRHPIVRQGLVDLINRDERLVICGETGNSDEALKLIMKCHPDLVVLILSLESGIGIEMVKGITSRYRIPVIVLSMDDEPIYGALALRV